jgi:hypothetical protein
MPASAKVFKYLFYFARGLLKNTAVKIRLMPLAVLKAKRKDVRFQKLLSASFLAVILATMRLSI